MVRRRRLSGIPWRAHLEVVLAVHRDEHDGCGDLQIKCKTTIDRKVRSHQGKVRILSALSIENAKEIWLLRLRSDKYRHEDRAEVSEEHDPVAGGVYLVNVQGPERGGAD